MNSRLTTPSNAAQPLKDGNGFKQRTLNQFMDVLSVLKKYFEDQEVNEIEINGPHDVFIDRGGVEFKVNVDLPGPTINTAITLIAALVNKEVGERSDRRILSGRLPGFRVEAILPPIAVYGPMMCIRRQYARLMPMAEYVEKGIISPKYQVLIETIVGNRENFLIGGGTSSGKTTLMNTVLSMVPADQRIVAIENVHELRLIAANKVAIEYDVALGVSARQAVESAMRLKPKRIFLGELRGPEAYDWMDAANTGHPGSGATIHANSAERTLARLENLLLTANLGIPYESIKSNIGESLQWVLYIQNTDSGRKLTQIIQIHDYDKKTGEYMVTHH